MAGVNKVMLVGNLGRDPEIKSTNNGSRIALFSVATSERWRDRTTGENQERTEWHKIVIFNEALVGVCERFLKKGSKVYLEGQLQTRKWQDQAGQDRYTTEVVLGRFKSELVLLDGRSEGINGDVPEAISSSGAQPTPAAAAGASQEIALDDDIPF